MSVKDREGVLAFLAQNAGGDDVSIADQRTRMDTLADFFAVPDGTLVEAASLGGVKGEWVRGPGVHRDAALLYLHGGGYLVGSPKSHRHLVAAIGAASGMAVFSADYRMAPEHPFPAAVDDAVAAYKALLDSGIAPARIAIAGDSAGGGLTLATLIALRDGGVPLPAAAAGLSAWTDLSSSNPSHKTRAARDPMIRSDGGLSDMAKAYLNGADPKTPLASPFFANLKGLPPLLLQVGANEVLYDDTVEFARRAEDSGVEVSCEVWGGMIHVWQIFHPILSEGRDAVARIGSFLKGHIG